MENRITILVGISGSGKSTWAHEQWLKNTYNVRIISRDSIRQLLFGFTEATVKDYYKLDNISSLEKEVTRYEDTLIHDALAAGKDVIVDATHLTRAYIDRFRFWNVSTEVVTFNVSPVEALKRDMKRVRQVGDAVIFRQYEQFVNLFKSLKDNPIDFTPVTITQDPRLKPCFIFDIDGTLAHMNGNRSPYDWAKVELDTLDKPVAKVLEHISNLTSCGNSKIIVCTGRDAISEYNTKKWLDNQGIIFDEYYTRKMGDSSPDWVVKEEMWRHIADRNHITAMFDDRLQVVRRARSLGLKVFNVEYGNF